MSRYDGYLDRIGGPGQYIPTGTIVPSTVALPTVDWLLCDGSYYSVANYPALASVLGHGYTVEAGTTPISTSVAIHGAYGAGLFVAPAYNSSSVLTSPDAITWTQRSAPSAATWIACAWSGSVFCMVSTNTAAATSSDGLSWSAQTLPVSGSWVGIVWDGSQFIVIGSTATYLTSPDGVNWTSRSLPVSANSGYICNNGSTTVVVARSTTFAATSTDGINWTVRILPQVADWNTVIWAGTQFIAAADSQYAATSPTGATWTMRPMPSSPAFTTRLAPYGSNITLAVGNSATFNVSTDGITWRNVPGLIQPALMPIAVSPRMAFWNGTKFSLLDSSSASTLMTVQPNNATFSVPYIATLVGDTLPVSRRGNGNYYIKT